MGNCKIKKIVLVFLTFTSLTSGETLLAQPHLLEGSFRLERSTEIGPLRLVRSYSSRSTRRGLFGFGWCSPLENSLQTKGATIEITDCPSRAKVSFSKAPPQSKSQRFLSSLGREKSSDLGRLVLRNEFGTLEKKTSQWIWTKPDGRKQIFDTAGRLLLSREGKAQDVKYDYDKSQRLSTLTFRSGEKIELRYQGYFVSSLRWKSTSISFNYRGLDLVRVKAPQREDELYKYDELNNMIFLTPASSQGINEIGYDVKDRMNFIGYTNACSEKFSFELLLPHVTAIHKTRSCPNGLAQSTFYKFLFKEQPDLQRVLSSVEIVQDQDKKIITFEGETMKQPKNL